MGVPMSIRWALSPIMSNFINLVFLIFYIIMPMWLSGNLLFGQHHFFWRWPSADGIRIQYWLFVVVIIGCSCDGKKGHKRLNMIGRLWSNQSYGLWKYITEGAADLWNRWRPSNNGCTSMIRIKRKLFSKRLLWSRMGIQAFLIAKFVGRLERFR